MKTYHITEWATELRVHYYSVEATSRAKAEEMYRDGQARLEGSKTKELLGRDWSFDEDEEETEE